MQKLINILEQRVKNLAANEGTKISSRECQEILNIVKSMTPMDIYVVTSNEGDSGGAFSTEEGAQKGKEDLDRDLGFAGSHCIAGIRKMKLQ